MPLSTAKATFGDFLEAFLARRPGQKSVLLKVIFEGDGEQLEHIWIADLELKSDRFSGVIANQPALPRMTTAERAQFDASAQFRFSS